MESNNFHLYSSGQYESIQRNIHTEIEPVVEFEEVQVKLEMINDSNDDDVAKRELKHGQGVEIEEMAKSEFNNSTNDKSCTIVNPTDSLTKPVKRRYQNHQREAMDTILNEIRQKNMGLYAASKKYGIPRNVLSLRLNEDEVWKQSRRQSILSQTEESEIVAQVKKLTSDGQPVNKPMIPQIVASYLNKKGRKIKKFNNNVPGYLWVKNFLKRNQHQISIATTPNSKDEKVNRFFDYLEREITDVPSSNIWNYDERCVIEDPRAPRLFVKLSSKHVQKITESSKSSLSMMICGNADGNIAPIYVVYKSERICKEWIENGPEKARYYHNKFGWFDYQSFQDWFTNMMLPILKKQPGKKVLIGTNMSSHINKTIIDLCHENDILFIAVLPSATHLFQPLDAAYFGPMESAWRKILINRNEKVAKNEYPAILKNLLNGVKENSARNLVAEFGKCGVLPGNRHEVFRRMRMRNDLTLVEGNERNVSKKERKSVNVPAFVDLERPSTSSGKTREELPSRNISDSGLKRSDSINESKGFFDVENEDEIDSDVDMPANESLQPHLCKDEESMMVTMYL